MLNSALIESAIYCSL